MRIAATCAFLLLLTACRASQPQAEVPSETSPCEARIFEGSRFTLCSGAGLAIELFTAGPGGTPLRSFAALEAALGPRAASVAFAMNAGMFDEEGKAIGLSIERGEQLHRISRRGGGGNFGLLPNGIFLIRESGKVEVVPTTRFKSADDIAFASQSGPMLVIAGRLHPAFEPDGQSRNIRNGVGIAPGGAPVFAISEEPVSFGKFARLFRDSVKAKDALYFDGSVSSLWDPAKGRRDLHAPLGPMVVAFRRAGSAPGREGPAKP